MLDPERMYQLTHAGDWPALLALIHRHPQAAAQDARVQHALATFEQTFFDTLDAASTLDGAQAEALETLILLHSGGIYALPEARFAACVVRLVTWYLERGDTVAARQYAPFCPDRPPCDALLREAGGPQDTRVRPEAMRAEVAHPQQDQLHVTVTTPATPADHAVSLFKSPPERAFFQAVRAAFPMYTPYPNVALSSLFDVEALRDALSAAACDYFFKGVVDCVVFDQHDDYRPVYFFELDSGLHDAFRRREKDDFKDRIVAAAGHRLYRVRPRTALTTVDDFAAMLHALFRSAREQPRGA